jgi:hypothetical protein
MVRHAAVVIFTGGVFICDDGRPMTDDGRPTSVVGHPSLTAMENYYD